MSNRIIIAILICLLGFQHCKADLKNDDPLEYQPSDYNYQEFDELSEPDLDTSDAVTPLLTEELPPATEATPSTSFIKTTSEPPATPIPEVPPTTGSPPVQATSGVPQTTLMPSTNPSPAVTPTTLMPTKETTPAMPPTILEPETTAVPTTLPAAEYPTTEAAPEIPHTTLECPTEKTSISTSPPPLGIMTPVPTDNPLEPVITTVSQEPTAKPTKSRKSRKNKKKKLSRRKYTTTTTPAPTSESETTVACPNIPNVDPDLLNKILTSGSGTRIEPLSEVPCDEQFFTYRMHS